MVDKTDVLQGPVKHCEGDHSSSELFRQVVAVLQGSCCCHHQPAIKWLSRSQGCQQIKLLFSLCSRGST